MEKADAMWPAIGLAVSLALLFTAAFKSKRAPSNYYEAHVYGMTQQTHRRYAAVGLLLGALFVAAWFVPAVPVAPLLGVCVLLAVFYFASFLRGFSDEE